MVLLLVLAIGLLSISAVELRQVQHSEALAHAKANARMGLMLALGDLQKELGPDKRITIPGDQKLDDTTVVPGMSWLGVYDSWEDTNPIGTTLSADLPGLTRPANPVFRRWMISGDPAVVGVETSVKNNTAPSSELVRLVPEVISNGKTYPAVQAGLINAKNGGTAWWVADQNMKAKISDPAVESGNYKEALAKLQSSPRVNHSSLVGATIPEDSGSLRNLITVGSVKLLSSGSDDLFHDATSYSRSLATNVRKGGLKRDLSLLFEKPWSTVLTDPDLKPLYRTGGSNSQDGISLKELWVYYNLWKELKTGRHLTPMERHLVPIRRIYWGLIAPLAPDLIHSSRIRRLP